MLTFNGIQGYNVCIEGDEDLKVLERGMEKEVDDGTLFVSITNVDGIYRYGYQVHKADPIWGHAAGYVWASRASVMNYNFGTHLIEAYYRKRGTQTYTSCAIAKFTLESFLDMDKYCIIRDDDGKNPEISYRVKERIN